MKKFFYILFSALMAVVACQKQQVEPLCSMEETGHGTYIFTIKALDAGIEPEVKSDYDAAGHFSWSAGDAISVLFHKGTENKFFTLTTASAGSPVTFSGEIESGYEIGASDGTSADKKIWALFPASGSHTYTAGGNPTFYVEPSVDFTAPGAHYSAGIPMYDLVASEAGGLSFKYLACAYKFIVEDLDDSIDKVRIEVSNQTTYGLSGSWPIADDKFIDFGYAAPGTEKSCLSYTANVTANKAVFYVSSRYWGTFQPIVTVYNADNGVILKKMTASAAKTPTNKTSVQPITISAPGTGSFLISEFGIDWGAVDMYPADDSKDSFAGDGARIAEWKVTSDATNLYFYYKIVASVAQTKGVWSSYINTGYDNDNNDATGGDNGYGLGGGYEAYSIIFPFTNGAGSPVTFRSGARSDNKTKVYNSGSFVESSSSVVATYGSLVGDYAYVEACVPREKVGSPSVGSTIRLNVSFGSTPSGAQTVTLK